MPQRLRVHLIPAERENADDVLRFVEASVRPDRTFALTNIAPGRYWLLARPISDKEPLEVVNRPLAWDANSRANLRREAEKANVAISLQSCQRMTDYTLPYAPLSSANDPKIKPAK